MTGGTARVVAVDVTPLTTGTTGVARYGAELLRAVERRGVHLRRFAVGRTRVAPPPGTRHLRVPLRVVQRLWSVTGRPRAEELTGPAELVHSLDLIPPPTRLPLVVTAHDLDALDHPELHPARSVAQQRRALGELHRAAVVLANSYATRTALIRHAVDETKIVVTPLAPTVLPTPVPPRLPGPFVLAVGELAPRKAFDVLLRGFAAADVGGVRLAVVGPDGGEGKRLTSLAARLGISERVQFLGRVGDGELSGLYRDAVALCSTSIAEGFGLPILEAMAAGVPVVATDIDVVREVAADAAYRFPPGDAAALAEAVTQVVQDEDRRRAMVSAGRARSELYSWEATADATVAGYERALCG